MHGLPKWLFVSLLSVVGIVLIVKGLGGTVPLVRFRGGEAYQLPVGILLVAAAVATAIWAQAKLRETESTTETTRTSIDPYSGVETTTTIVETTRTRETQLAPPPGGTGGGL